MQTWIDWVCDRIIDTLSAVLRGLNIALGRE